MKLFLISQTENTEYNTYDEAVVRAESKEDARLMHPGSGSLDWSIFRSWCSSPEDVTVEYLGESVNNQRGIVCASYNAG